MTMARMRMARVYADGTVELFNHYNDYDMENYLKEFVLGKPDRMVIDRSPHYAIWSEYFRSREYIQFWSFTALDRIGTASTT